ncbi:hypothetical protein VZG28_05235 [Synechococcus elongatus IITB4]|uniref:Acb2/Tad1 domain-containing protein n=1 Tax=Synechococcus elongatus TaxID=32046 RepID=UPI0030D465B5
MPRLITTHQVNDCNRQLLIGADERGNGNASHYYVIGGFDSNSNLSDPNLDTHGPTTKLSILFQDGPILEAGVNGITHEVLLAILIDRLQGFQLGPYVCRENALALTKLEEAMHWLNARTLLRTQRGVKGTSEV